MEHHDLDKAPDYYALSYTWGSGYLKKYYIHLDGGSCTIGPNLHGALRAIRRTITAPTLVWADAICINQEDRYERNQQVQMMGQIYQGAETVVVWLGEDAGAATRKGIQAIRFFVDPSRVESEAPWYDHPESSSTGLVDIFSRTWWSRAWTVQEAVLAHKVTLLCGTSETTWTTDMQTLQKIKSRIKMAVISPQWQKEMRDATIAGDLEPDPVTTSPALAKSGFKNIELEPLLELIELQIRERADESGLHLRRNLLDVVYDLRHREAVDPRDQIVAVLGLAEGRDMELGGFRVDYSHTIEQVHEEMMKAIQRLRH
ncbi:hypothetical protein N0V82_005406 [Gnomoniopsis sp. IMI 355080]|nr:hypothetical protein N0V82_005406 [Gnomoniopsis sp. IMI 355080]